MFQITDTVLYKSTGLACSSAFTWSAERASCTPRTKGIVTFWPCSLLSLYYFLLIAVFILSLLQELTKLLGHRTGRKRYQEQMKELQEITHSCMSTLYKESIEEFNFGTKMKRTVLSGYIPLSYSYFHIHIWKTISIINYVHMKQSCTLQFLNYTIKRVN